MNKGLRIALVTTVIFSSGLAAGHSLSGLRAKAIGRQSHSRVDGERRGGPASQAPGPMGQRLEFLRRAQQELDLNPDQRARVEAHLDESRERIRKLWEPITPQVRAETEALKGKIRAELTPDQIDRFDRLVKNRNRRGDRGEARDRRGGPDPDRGPRPGGEAHRAPDR